MPTQWKTAVRSALNELGVPDENYPAPVANAVAILSDLLKPTETTAKAWYPSDAQWACSLCPAEYKSGGTPFGGSLSCRQPGCTTIATLMAAYPQPKAV